MGLTREELEFVARVVDLDRLKDLNKETEAQTLTIAELAKAKAAGLVTDAAYEAQMRRSVASLQANQAELTKLQGSLHGVNGAIRNLGYGVSDIFANNGPLGSKLIGFGNNVGNITTGILQMLGKTGPQAQALAAGIEIAFNATGSALNAFGIKSLEDFKRLFTGVEEHAGGVLKGLQDRIKELTDKPHLIPIEMRELNAARDQVEAIKRALEAVKRLQSGQTEAEHKSGQEVGKAINEATDDRGNAIGGPGVHDRLRQQIAAEMQAVADADAKAEREKIEKEISDLSASMPSDEGAAAARLQEIKGAEAKLARAKAEAAKRRARITEAEGDQPAAADVELGTMVDQAVAGHGGQQEAAQQKLRDRLGRAGLKGVATDVAGAGPEQVAQAGRNEEATRRFKAQEDAEKDAAAKKKKADDDAAKEREALAKQQEGIRAQQDKDRFDREKEDATAREKARQHADHARGQEFTRQAKETAENVSANTSIDELAGTLAAQLRADGKLTDAQQRAQVRAAVTDALNQVGIKGGQAVRAADVIQGQAFGQVDQQAETARLNLSQQGLEASEAGRRASEMVVGQMETLAAWAVRQQGASDALVARIEAIQNATARLRGR